MGNGELASLAYGSLKELHKFVELFQGAGVVRGRSGACLKPSGTCLKPPIQGTKRGPAWSIGLIQGHRSVALVSPTFIGSGREHRGTNHNIHWFAEVCRSHVHRHSHLQLHSHSHLQRGHTSGDFMRFGYLNRWEIRRGRKTSSPSP